MAATSVFAKPQDPALQLVPALSMQPVDHRAEQGEQVLVDNVEPRLAKAVSAADLIMLGNTAAPKVAMNSAAAIGRAAGLGQAMSLGEAESQKALQRISSLHESSKQMEQVLAEPTSSLDLLIKSAAESFDALDVAGVDPILVSSGPGTPISAVPATPAVSDSDSQMAIVGTPVDTHVDMDSVTAAILAETASTSTFAKSLNMPESIAVQEVVQVETTIPVAETPLIAAPELAHANVDILAEEIAQLSANDSDAIVAEAIALAKVDTSVVSDMASTTAIVTPLFNPSTTDTRVFNRTSSDAHKAVGFTEPPVEIVSTPTITRGKSKFGSFFASQKTLGQDAEVVPTEPKEAHKPKMGVKGFVMLPNLVQAHVCQEEPKFSRIKCFAYNILKSKYSIGWFDLSAESGLWMRPLVEYVLAAEFDIEKGSLVSFQYPSSTREDVQYRSLK